MGDARKTGFFQLASPISIRSTWRSIVLPQMLPNDKIRDFSHIHQLVWKYNKKHLHRQWRVVDSGLKIYYGTNSCQRNWFTLISHYVRAEQNQKNKRQSKNFKWENELARETSLDSWSAGLFQLRYLCQPPLIRLLCDLYIFVLRTILRTTRLNKLKC